MAVRLIGLCGYATSGKDCAAQALTAQGWVRVAFADAVRDAALALDPIVLDGGYRLRDVVLVHGWDWAKQMPEVRRLLQRMGTEAGRNIHGEYCWTSIACRKAATASRNGKSVVFTDVRFKNEAAAIREMGGKVYRINRPGVGPKNDHASERLDFAVDGVIENDGDIELLHQRVLALAGV